MKSLLALVTLSLTASPAFAEVKKVGSFDRYSFNYETKQPITLKITMKRSTHDGCNDFILRGDIRRQEIPADVQTIAQDLVADLSVMQTLMGCPRLDQPREVVMESKPFLIKPISGRVTGTLLVPAGAEVSLQ